MNYPFRIFIGNLDTMQNIANHGVRGLNPKTLRYEVVDYSAMLVAIQTNSGNGEVPALGELRFNIDLFSIAE